MSPRKIKRYGWKRSLPDHRDYLFKNLSLPSRNLPAKVDLSLHCSPVENQGELGSCTGNALAGAIEYLEMTNNSFLQVSRLFIYYNERAIEGTVSMDSGAEIKDGIKCLASLGVCSEEVWPYVISKFATKPNAKCFADALSHKITSYHKVVSFSDMKTALANGFPFVFGFTVYEGFESPQVGRTGVLNLPKKSERLIGGHAVLCVGYDDSTSRFLVRNSWGDSWGQKGYFTMPYSYMTDPNLATDMWVIMK